jgi:hypothetical protein
MVPLPLICNECGECCRHGGQCTLRSKSWSLRDLPLDFTGTCELLTADSKCSVMQGVVKQEGSMALLRKYMRVVGTCDYPDFRLASPLPSS